MADMTLEQIRDLIQANRYQEALASLKALLNEQPENGEVRVLLTEVQEKMMLQMQITEMTRRANDFMEKGQPEDAKKIMGEILRIDPKNGEAKAFIDQMSGPAPAAPGLDTGASDLPSLGAFTAGEQVPDDGLQDLPPLDTFDTVPPTTDLPPERELPTLDAGEFGMPEPIQPAAPAEGAPPPSFSTFEMEDSAPLGEATVLSGEAPQVPALGAEELERIQKYISDGKALLQGGNYQDAIDTWTRVFILDESNTEVQKLIDGARSQLSSKQGELEYTLTEAIAAFNAEDFARAKPLLEKVLAAFPGHREATQYLDRIESRAPAPEPAASTFEMDSAVPTPPAASTFELDSGASAPPAASTFEIGGDEPSGGQEFILDTGKAEADAGPPPGDDLASGDVDWVGLPPTTAQPEDAQVAPEIAPPPMPPEEFPVEDPKPAKGKPARKRPSLAFILVAVILLPIIGLGIIFLPKFLQSDPDAPVAPAPTSVSDVLAPVEPQPDPGEPGDDAQPDGGETPIEELGIDQLFIKAGEERDNKRFEEAVVLYQEILARDEANKEAFENLRSARQELREKREQEVRVEQFLRDYTRTVDNFQAEQYRECLRLAWRLVYPDDTLAVALGKKDALDRILRDGYYNWAVLNLQYNNVHGALTNLTECLVMYPGDAEAQDLKAFAEKYTTGTLDASFRDVVRTLKPRPFKDTE